MPTGAVVSSDIFLRIHKVAERIKAEGLVIKNLKIITLSL
jgi:hypothetical protein